MESTEDRMAIVAEYYEMPIGDMAKIASLAQPERKPICKDLGINPYVIRTMLDYSRYNSASFVHDMLLEFNEDISGLNILDFGCLVADYGMFLGRRGAKAAIYDEGDAVKFAAYRFGREGLPVTAHTIPTDYGTLMRNQHVAIFGEVLEHLDNPILPIQACVDENVKYIFTSCYPFGGKAYYQLSGHMKSAQDLQPDCIRLLSNNYDAYPDHDKAILWKRISSGLI